eukprot:CAMPEP_0185850342 /NCGR_PEP_ID=MMETSP1354-20130828/4510_1 /TAXON_ID=708628 /ORGANISM="Erythrolobus madagascarensis, Strain CCMP3276" /LENGTH=335 /DNA_ID=CAMNT_0028551009 /DNA_START=85 /DNA_END=1092 /DNA_ORIENTATION=+
MCMPQFREYGVAARDQAAAAVVGWTTGSNGDGCHCVCRGSAEKAASRSIAPPYNVRSASAMDALHRELLGAVCARKASQMAASATRFQYSRVMDELVDRASRRRAEQEAQSAQPPQHKQAATRFPNKSVFIFDFDDTLMATTYFEKTKMFAMGEVPGRQQGMDKDQFVVMQRLDAAVVQVLKQCAKYGETLIVTNAGAGWVELASSQFLPGLKQYIAESGIRVISARSSYSHIPIESASEWKVECFSDQLRSLFPSMTDINMLVFGDSIGDQYAAHCSFAKLSGCSLLKFVKFAERPTPAHLVHQLTVLRDNLPNLVSHTACFDVNVTKPSATNL